MRFKIDEHLPVEIKELLTHHQHDAVTVPDESMAGAVDADVAQACQKEARALVTLDLDFSDIRAYPPEDYQGIIVFRLALQSVTTIVRSTTRIIPLLDQEPLIGHLWIVEDHQVRIREGSQGGTRVR
jgi:predicted nuclease of predicted toxin-antitoxin system